MGIRFRCHHCEQELNLKNFQGGRRARCPGCSGRFRVPTGSQDFSIPLDEAEEELTTSLLPQSKSGAAQASPNFDLQQPGQQLSPQPGQRLAASAEPARATDRVPTAQLPKAERKAVAPRKNESEKDKPSAVDQPQTNSSVAESATQPQATPQLRSREKGPATSASAPSEPALRMPKAIAEAPQAVWYVRPPSGGQFGPADGNVFFQWMKENRVARDALVWRDGWPQWMVAAEAFEETYEPKWLEPEVPKPTEPSINIADQLSGTSASPASASMASASMASAAMSSASLAASSTTTAPASDALPAPALPISSLANSALPVKRQPLSAARRKRTRNNYLIGIAILGILATTLIVVLLYVLSIK